MLSGPRPRLAWPRYHVVGTGCVSTKSGRESAPPRPCPARDFAETLDWPAVGKGSLRLPIGLLLAAAPSAAQDLPLIRAAGTSLETFEVELRLEAVEHATAEGLAKSFARFQAAQHGVRRRFAELVRDAHLDLLRGCYAKDLVDRQAKAYGAVEQKGYHCEVTGVTPEGDKATAQIRRTYVEGGKQREETSEVSLVHNGRRWEIAAIRDRVPDGRLVERGLGAPPALKRVPLPAPATPDLSSAKAAVTSLRGEILRFGALRDNASLALTDRFFDILAAFYGEDTARKARAGRPQTEPPSPVFVEVGDGAPRLADLVRVEVTVSEEVPGRKDLRSAIANAAFDLRPEGGKWKIVSEHLRPDPEMAFAPVTRNFGLFFLVRR